MTATPTPAALTSEELADRVVASFILQTGAGIAKKLCRDAIAAAIRQHSEADRAEIERLKEQNADLKKAALTAYEFGIDHAFEAADDSAAAEAALAEAKARYLAGIQRRYERFCRMRERAEKAEAALAKVTAERDSMKRKAAAANKGREAAEAEAKGARERWARAVARTIGRRRAIAELQDALERERGMREALTGLADIMEHECDVLPCVWSMAPAERYLGLARDLLQQKDATDGPA